MTVKELIEVLNTFDEELEVLITDNNWNESINDVGEYGDVVIISAQNQNKRVQPNSFVLLPRQTEKLTI